jgi:hypothetical protein
MKDTYTAWILGGVALILSVACIVLNVVIASALAGIRVLAATRVLAYITFGVNLAAAISFVFFITVFVQKLNNRSISFDHKSAWRRFGVCAGISALAAVLSASVLIWLVVRERQLRPHVLHQSSKIILVLWFVLWGITAALQTAVFSFVGLWTKRVLQAQSVGQLRLNFGLSMPPMDEVHPHTHGRSRSFQSQDLTLNSPPRTPSTSCKRSSSLRNSSSTKGGPGSSRTKRFKGSDRSSSDCPAAFPAGEATSIESAFDNWDTSSVHREIRLALHSSPPATRGTLETIPGSRSASPANALDGPFLPESPRACSSSAATALDWNYGSSSRQFGSSPPSSSPNLSRPTSSVCNQSVPTGLSMTELIHPLFRPDSPRPPPIAVAGTMVTASPMAGQPITPRTLARMRSNTLPQYWTSVPSSAKSSSGGSNPNSPGSPGPSIVEEVDLPPILPGFVLSAGQRSSLLGYGRRKSTKERPQSSHSC